MGTPFLLPQYEVSSPLYVGMVGGIQVGLLQSVLDLGDLGL